MPKSTFGQKLKQARGQIFVGRKEQIELFHNNLKLGAHSDDFLNIFNVYGQGGVGKTTLVKHFIKIAEQEDTLTVLLDMEDARLYTIPAVMAKIAEELGEHRFNFKKFNKLYKEYLQKKSELDADMSSSDSMIQNIASDTVKIGIGTAAELIPGGGIVREFLPVDTIAEGTGKIADYAWRKFGNRDDVELTLYPLKTLTPVWLDELRDCYDKKNIAIFLDTYETANPSLDEWFVDLLNEEFGAVPGNILLTFSGRDKLDVARWGGFGEFISNIPLSPFAEDEARGYLLKKGIKDEKVIDSIISVSGCLPVYLTLLVDENPKEMEDISHPTDKVVEIFLRYVKNPTHKKLARLAALPRKLNVDVIKRLLSKEEYYEGIFDWLKGLSFVQNRGGFWTYHPVVKKLLMSFNQEESSEEWEKIHYNLAAYYEERAKRIEQDDKKKNYNDEEWRNLNLEGWYHRLCANYKKELPGFMLFYISSAYSGVPHSQMMPYADTLIEAEKACDNEEWGELFKTGIEEIAKEKSDEGLQLYLKLIEKDFIHEKAEKAYLFAVVGYVYSDKKDEDRALEYFKESLNICPDNLYGLGGMAVSFSRMGNFDDAIKYCEKAIEIEASNEHSWNRLGFIYHNKPDYEKAIECYKKSIEINPNNYSAWSNMGSAYNYREDYEKAVECYKKAIEINPNNRSAWNGLGNVCSNQKDYEKAIECYNKAIEIKPDYYHAWTGLGSVYNDQKDYEKAIEQYKKALEINPDFHNAWNGLGNVYNNQKDYAKAVEYYKKVLEIDPNYYYSWSNLGIIYNDQEDYEKAIEHHKKALEINPNYFGGWSNLGNVYLSQKDYAKAKEHHKKALEINPNYFGGWSI